MSRMFQRPKFAKVTNELVAPTPIYFDNSLYFNFIIKGNMDKLQKVCNEWFNVPSNFKRVFEPALPYVMVTYAYYPRAYYQSWKENNEGFTPYKELIFVLFLREKKPCGILEDIGLIKPNFYGFVPFLFLDHAIPVAAGREIFGMPKVMADLDYPGLGGNGTVQKFSASTLGFNRSRGSVPMAKKQKIMEVTCPPGFNMEEILSKAHGNPSDAIAREFFRNVETNSVNLNLAAMMIKIHEMSYISMRQYRDVIETDKAITKSIIEFPGKNLTVTNGGILPGQYDITYGENSLTYPVKHTLGLANQPTVSFWFQWDFYLSGGKQIWEWKE